MKFALHGLVLVAVAASVTFAADVNGDAADVKHGRYLAQRTCVACHIVGEDRRAEFADAPPFEVIVRKYRCEPARLLGALLDPHPKMNMPLGAQEADDIAAYLLTLPP